MKTKIFESSRNRMVIILMAFIVFVIYKFNDIFLPYFWDEISGYMIGVLYLLDHGISILPSAIPPEASYGHPLLVHVVMASIAKVFGSSVAVMHTTTLIFTFFLAYGTYLLAYSLSKNYAISIFSYLLCLVQPIVIAQSTQVLLEIFLAMTCVYAVYFYTKEKYVLSAFFCVLSVLTKETGIVLPIAFMVQHFMELMRTRDSKKWLYLSVLYSIPIIVFGCFLLIQKQTHGWYLNPVNTGKAKLAIGSIIQKIWDYPLEFTFVNQGRFALSIVLFVAIVTYLFREFKTSTWCYNRNIMQILVFCFGFSIFSSIADAIERYFLVLIPFAVILFSAAIWYVRNLHRALPFVLLCGCIAVSFLYIDNGKKYTDVDMSYRHLVKTSVMVFDYMNSGEFAHDTIDFVFPLTYAASDARYGYFKTKRFISGWGSINNSNYFIYISPGRIDSNPPDTLQLTVIKEFRSGYSKALVYKKIRL